MGQPLGSTSDWMGSYTGRFDGRNAVLEIWQVYEIYPPDGFSFGVSFTDLDRKTAYTNSGYPHIENTGPKANEVNNLNLYVDIHDSAKGQVTFSHLFLHTADTDYISGSSWWNGHEYGVSFSRQSKPQTPKKVIDKWLSVHRAVLENMQMP